MMSARRSHSRTVVTLVLMCAAFCAAPRHAHAEGRLALQRALLSGAHADELNDAAVAGGDSVTSRKKSRVLAGLYSAMLPGMGELYGGNFETGRYFTAGEALLWLGYAGMTIFGNAMIADARTYADAHAAASTSGKDDAYLTNVGNFLNEAQYNDKKARDGDYRLIYTTPGYTWRWDNDSNRAFFRNLHVRANGILDNTKYLVAAIVLNHFASAVDAVLQVNRYNKNLAIGIGPRYNNGEWGTVASLRVGW